MANIYSIVDAYGAPLGEFDTREEAEEVLSHLTEEHLFSEGVYLIETDENGVYQSSVSSEGGYLIETDENGHAVDG